MTKLRRNAGFSLIELMISASLILLVMVVVTRTFTVQHKTYTVVDQTSEAQQNLRAISDLIERDVRRSGYMVPGNAGVCAWDRTTGPDTLFVSNTDVLETIFDLEDENEDLDGNFGAPLTGVSSSYTRSGIASIGISQTWVDVDDADGDSVTDVDFAVGAGVILVNRRDTDGLVACGIIATQSSTSLTVDFGSTTFGPAGMNADVVAVPAHVYQLAVGNPNELRRDGVLVASDVEDFQLTFFFDDDRDGVVDGGEMFGNNGGTAQPWELTPATNRPDFSSLRDVGINIVTVTRTNDPNTDYQIGAGEITGNRTTGLPTADGKRRRVNSARVQLRNRGV